MFGAIGLAGVAFTDVVGERCFTIVEVADFEFLFVEHHRLRAVRVISGPLFIKHRFPVAILGIQLELELFHLAAVDLLGHLRCPRALGCVCINKDLTVREINGHITAIARGNLHRVPFGEISDLYFSNRVVGVGNVQHLLCLGHRCFKFNLVDSLVASHARNGIVTGVLNEVVDNRAIGVDLAQIKGKVTVTIIRDPIANFCAAIELQLVIGKRGILLVCTPFEQLELELSVFKRTTR